MPYTYEQMVKELAGKNAVLARISNLKNTLEAVVDYLHDGSPDLVSALSDNKKRISRYQKRERHLRREGKHAFADKQKKHIADFKKESDRLKARIKRSVESCNESLKKTNSTHFSLNTFEWSEGHVNPSFEKLINEFVELLEEEKAYVGFKSGMLTHPLFDSEGNFKRSSSIVAVVSDLAWREKVLATYIDGAKRLYNHQHTRIVSPADDKKEVYSYFVELHTSLKKDQVLSEWVAVLCDKPSINQRRNELIKQKQNEDLANEALLQEIALGYLKKKEDEYFEDLSLDAGKKKEIELLRNKNSLDEADIALVMSLIQEELDQGRRVYAAVELSKRKDKTLSLYIKQWTTLFAVLGTIGEACLSTYAMVQAMGYSSTSGSLFHFLGTHPAAAAAAVAIFVSVLLVNTILFNMLMKDLLGLVAKKRLMKNKDGTEKTKSQKQALGWGMFVSVVTAVGLGALSFNGCQAAFSAFLQSTPTSAAVLAIASAIALVTFFAMVSFNYQFFLEVFSDWKGYKKQMDRMFLKGRCEAGKRILLALCSALAVLYTVGSLMVNFASVDKMLQDVSMAQMASKSLNGILTGISGFFYALAGFSANRGMLTLFRAKCSEMNNFFKHNKGQQLAGKVLAFITKSVASIVLFFPAAVALVIVRMALAAVKLVLNFVGLVAGVFSGLAHAVAGKGFATGFHKCATLNQKVTDKWDNVWGWWKGAFMYCAKRGALFGAVLNAVSQAALRQVDMKGINTAVVVPTLLDSALLSAVPNADAADQATGADDNAKVVSAMAENSIEGKTELETPKSTKRLGFWGTFGASMAKQFTPNKDVPKSAEHLYLEDVTVASHHCA